MQQLALELLALNEFAAAAGAGWPACLGCSQSLSPAPQPIRLTAHPACAGPTLTELAVFGYVCSRPLCALLPRFPALTRLSLCGYQTFINLEPLQHLPRLEALHVEAEALPPLDPLPPSVRHLSLSCFANAARHVGRAGLAGRYVRVRCCAAAALDCLRLYPLAPRWRRCRVALPQHLELDSLTVHSAQHGAFVALSRAMAVCRSLHILASHVHLLLKVRRARFTALP